MSALLFDLDDTLLDRRASVDHYLARHAERVGFSRGTASEYRARFWELDGAGYVPRATVFEQLVEQFPDCGITTDLVADWKSHAFDTCVFIEGALEILEWSRGAGLRTAIITNGRASFQRSKLERLSLVPAVDEVLVSGEEGIHKPEADLFRRAADRLGVAASDCVYVGDNPHNDVLGAEAAGMQAIWFERDLPWPPDVPRPRHAIRDLRVLRDLVALASTE
ncbi:MAG: HAD family hydrolase [Solirubrobacteraceae bacterium]